MEFNYKPKFYDCVLNGIRTEGSKHLFDFTEKKTEGRNQIQIDKRGQSLLFFLQKSVDNIMEVCYYIIKR